MPDHESLRKARELVVRNILAGERPEPDEMLLMSESYQKVWADHDAEPSDPDRPDWASVLD